jgi:ABC-type Fe3+ transport system permease subunit
MDQDTQQLSEQMETLGPAKTNEAYQAAGFTLPGYGDVPDKAWDKMNGWQAWSLLVLMFLVVAAIFVLLLLRGIDLATAKDASDTAKAIGSTLIGAALGLIGATAVGAGAAVKK